MNLKTTFVLEENDYFINHQFVSKKDKSSIFSDANLKIFYGLGIVFLLVLIAANFIYRQFSFSIIIYGITAIWLVYELFFFKKNDKKIFFSNVKLITCNTFQK